MVVSLYDFEGKQGFLGLQSLNDVSNVSWDHASFRREKRTVETELVEGNEKFLREGA